METTQSWEITLSQNIEKAHPNVPDFLGEALIGTTHYDVAAWLKEISKGSNTGRPFVSVQLTSKSNTTQKVSISLWEKQDRQRDADPHFKTREKLNGQQLTFYGWIVPDGDLYALRVAIEPFSALAGDLSEAALETHQRLTAFIAEAQLRLPNGQRPELPATQSDPPPAPARKVAGPKPGTGAEHDPDDIPF
jgi:hypothetical protein